MIIFTILSHVHKDIHRCLKLAHMTDSRVLHVVQQLAFYCPLVTIHPDNLYWSCELGTYNFIPTANVITSDDNTQSDSLTLFHPVGFKLTASPWPVLSNHMHSASISSCQMCLASGIQSLRSARCVLFPFTCITALSHWPHLPYDNSIVLRLLVMVAMIV